MATQPQNNTLVEALVRLAVRKSPANSAPDGPIAWLDQLIEDNFTQGSSGRAVMRVNEAGGNVDWQFIPNMTPIHMIEMAKNAIKKIEAAVDPTNPLPPAGKYIRRLRVSFGKSAI